MTCTAAAIGLLLLAAGITTAVASNSQRESWVDLGNDRVGDYLWEAKAKRQGSVGGQGGPQQPCLIVGTTWELSPFNYRRSKSRVCAGASTQLSASEPPLIATGAQPSSGKTVRMTAVGMVFAPAVRRVLITLPGGGRQTIRLRAIAPALAASAGLRRFRYSAFAVRGAWCAERLISESADGTTLWDSGTDSYSCGDSGAAQFEAVPERSASPQADRPRRVNRRRCDA